MSGDGEKPIKFQEGLTEEEALLPPDRPQLPAPVDRLPAYDKPLSPRHRELARLLAIGASNKQIESMLGYCGSRISVLKQNPTIMAYVSKLQDKIFDRSIDERLKEMGTEAMDVVEEALTSDELELKDKVIQARWLIEKLTGKPAQQVDHKGEVHIGVFMDKIERLLDVTPNKKPQEELDEALPEDDQHTKWLDKNI